MHTTDLLPGADAPRRVGDSLKSDSGVCAYMAKIRKKDFIPGGASEFEIISDNAGLYIVIALAVIGAAAALI
jgi:cell division FtsZ-interacting protein ZapD